MGDSMSARGIEPDEIKIKAILGVPRPIDKNGALRLIGKFIPSYVIIWEDDTNWEGHKYQLQICAIWHFSRKANYKNFTGGLFALS